MSAQRIELRALVSRLDEVLLIRRLGDTWELPGGSFDDDADDMDAAMDSLLRGYGIATTDIAQAFLRTCYDREGDTRVVINLYAPLEWFGEPAVPTSAELTWVPAAELPHMEIGSRMLKAALIGLGMAIEDEPVIPGMAAIAGEGLRFPDRHAGGLDVLRTLRATDDAGPAFETMQGSLHELAPDVVDFALGEVWTHPALDRKTRSLQVVAMLAALGGKPSALRSHLNGALNHGASPAELVQTLRMVAVYGGFPAALEAWPVMESVFDARGIARPGGTP